MYFGQQNKPKIHVSTLQLRAPRDDPRRPNLEASKLFSSPSVSQTISFSPQILASVSVEKCVRVSPFLRNEFSDARSQWLECAPIVVTCPEFTIGGGSPSPFLTFRFADDKPFLSSTEPQPSYSWLYPGRAYYSISLTRDSSPGVQ